MKTSSLPNPAETTTFPSFFSFFKRFSSDNDSTLNKRSKTSHSDGTEATLTSPPKGTILPFNNTGLSVPPGSVVMVDSGSEQKGQTHQSTCSMGSNQNLTGTRSSVGSNRSGGIVGSLLEGHNFSSGSNQLSDNVRAFSEARNFSAGNLGSLSEGQNYSLRNVRTLSEADNFRASSERRNFPVGNLRSLGGNARALSEGQNFARLRWNN